MPAVLDTHELLEHVETHDLHIEKPLARRSHPGFWRTLAHGITKHLTPMPHEWQAPSCSPRRPSRPPWTGSHGSIHPSLSSPSLSSDNTAHAASSPEHRAHALVLREPSKAPAQTASPPPKSLAASTNRMTTPAASRTSDDRVCV